jgi:hypothetical protein
LLRARALPEEFDDRYEALTAAAAELGRAHSDMDVVSRAVEAGRGPFDDEPLSLSADQAREVLRKEKASSAFPSSSRPGPDYSELFSGELRSYPFDQFDIDDDPLDEEEIKRLFFEKAPEEIPRDLLPALFEVAKESLISGEDPVEILSELLGEDVPAGKNQSGAKNRPGAKNGSGGKHRSGAKKKKGRRG